MKILNNGLIKLTSLQTIKLEFRYASQLTDTSLKNLGGSLEKLTSQKSPKIEELNFFIGVWKLQIRV